MRAEPDIARVAGAIGDRARAAMLTALLSGRAMSAGELARHAGIAPSTATQHLRRLLGDGLIVRRVEGRHRLHTLSGEEVASALEALARLSPAAMDHPGAKDPLRFARTCYDHLAGALSVAVADALVQSGVISADMSSLGAGADSWLRRLDIDPNELRGQRRALVRPCLDWSERRNHVAGAFGAAIADVALERRWLVRLDGTRGLRLTLRGQEGFRRALGVEIV